VFGNGGSSGCSSKQRRCRCTNGRGAFQMAVGTAPGSALKWDCCADGERVWLIGVVPRSDGEGEFGEGRREPMLWVEFHAKFVVAAADV
jgi:hypothetical protein